MSATSPANHVRETALTILRQIGDTERVHLPANKKRFRAARLLVGAATLLDEVAAIEARTGPLL